MDKLRIGIIGCAGISWKQFIPAIALAKNAELVAISSRSAEKCSDFSAKYLLWHLIHMKPCWTQTRSMRSTFHCPTHCTKNGASKQPIPANTSCAKNLWLWPLRNASKWGKQQKRTMSCWWKLSCYRFHPVTARIIRDVQEGILSGLEPFRLSIRSCWLTKTISAWAGKCTAVHWWTLVAIPSM